MCAFRDVAFKTSFALSLSSHGLTLVIVSFVPIFDLLSDVSFSIPFLLPEPLNFAVPVEIAIACRSAAVMISCYDSPSRILVRKRPPLCQKYLNCNPRATAFKLLYWTNFSLLSISFDQNFPLTYVVNRFLMKFLEVHILCVKACKSMLGIH